MAAAEAADGRTLLTDLMGCVRPADSSLPLRLAERLFPGRDLAGVLDLDGLLAVLAVLAVLVGAVAGEHAALMAAWDAPVSDGLLEALGR